MLAPSRTLPVPIMSTHPPRTRARLRTLVARALAAHGFSAQGNQFFRFRDDFVQVVYLQGSRYSKGRTYVRSHLLHATEPLDKLADGNYDVMVSASDALDGGEHPCLALDEGLPADAAWSEQVTQALGELVANLDELTTLEQVLAENAKPSGRANVMQRFREQLLRDKGLRVP